MEDLKELKVTIDAPGEHTFLFGKAQDPEPLNLPVQILFAGHLDSVGRYLDKMKDLIDVKKAIVSIDRRNLLIRLECNPADKKATTVEGSLVVNPDLEKFHINKEKMFKLPELRRFLRMSKMFFNDESTYQTLISSLEKFSTNVQTEIKNMRDSGGNINVGIKRAVDPGFTNYFTLNMPIFEGEESKIFQVEIATDVRDMEIDYWLESTELIELFENEKNRLIDEQIIHFQPFDYVILEK